MPTNPSTPQQMTEAALWHALREVQNHNNLLATAAYNLVSTMDVEIDVLPAKTRRMRERLVGELPSHFQDQLTSDDGEEPMGPLSKGIVKYGLPLLIGAVLWAYYVTYMQ